MSRHKVYDLLNDRNKPDIQLITQEMNELSMNYIGNKRKILGWIYKCLEDEGIFLEDYNVFDCFAGGGSFAMFAKLCDAPVVVTNDLMKNAWVNHKVLVEGDSYSLTPTEKSALLDHQGIYKELLDWLVSQDYKWFSDSQEKKNEMITYVRQKSLGNKYLEFMLNYCDKFFTLKECIELASFREFIDKQEELQNEK